MGLKQFRLNPSPVKKQLQQSHHCGIETKLQEFELDGARLQQSHHCGIETMAIFASGSIRQNRSNRTIVGLKPNPSQLRKIHHNLQQSHHCGIETHGR